MVKLPPLANAEIASSLLRTTTNSLRSAPIWSPNPTPPVAMQDGADQVPSGRRAITIPDPALPDQTKPAFKTVKMARLRVGFRVQDRESQFRAESLSVEAEAGQGWHEKAVSIALARKQCPRREVGPVPVPRSP